MQHAAPVFGAVLFAGTVAPALNALPGLVAAIVGEVLEDQVVDVLRAGGGASLAAIPILAAPDSADLPRILASPI